MNRAQIAMNLLMQHGTVTNGYIDQTRIIPPITFRNAISECRKILPAGFEIVTSTKGDWKDHSYTLRRVGELPL